jgi:hypothetical protein
VKIEPRQVDAFLKKPDPKIRGVVIYGNDDGLIAERALALAKTVCEDLKDPFRVVDIGGAIRRGPGRPGGCSSRALACKDHPFPSAKEAREPGFLDTAP